MFNGETSTKIDDLKNFFGILCCLTVVGNRHQRLTHVAQPETIGPSTTCPQYFCLGAILWVFFFGFNSIHWINIPCSEQIGLSLCQCHLYP